MNSAKTIRHFFSRETCIDVDIRADQKTIWDLLTDAANYPKWNTTVISIEGTIALGEKIKLISTLDPKRVFNLSVKECIPERKLVWGDAMGKREYLLTERANGQTNVLITEKIGGPLFPLFARMIPSFDESFEAFARDLKIAAEQVIL